MATEPLLTHDGVEYVPGTTLYNVLGYPSIPMFLAQVPRMFSTRERAIEHRRKELVKKIKELHDKLDSNVF